MNQILRGARNQVCRHPANRGVKLNVFARRKVWLETIELWAVAHELTSAIEILAHAVRRAVAGLHDGVASGWRELTREHFKRRRLPRAIDA